MGASGHCGNGLHRIGPRHGAAWSNRRAGWNVRGIREGARTSSVISRGVFRMVGLGLVAGAVLHRPLAAQDTTKVRRDTTLKVPVPQRADSLLRDTLAKQDSIKAQKPVPRDTIKAALAHSELPALPGIGRRTFWSRDSLFSTGAITLADLLDRID